MERQELPVVKAARIAAMPETCVAECPVCDYVIELKHYQGERTGTRCPDCDRCYIVEGIENE